MILAWVLLVLLLLGALAFVAAPLLRGAKTAQREEEKRDLVHEREAALQLLRDLEHDRQTGKLDSDDYAAQRAEAEGRAIQAMRRLDALGVAEGGDPLEAAIRLERIRLQKGARR